MNVTIDDDVMFRNATLTACPLKNMNQYYIVPVVPN